MCQHSIRKHTDWLLFKQGLREWRQLTCSAVPSLSIHTYMRLPRHVISGQIVDPTQVGSHIKKLNDLFCIAFTERPPYTAVLKHLILLCRL